MNTFVLSENDIKFFNYVMFNTNSLDVLNSSNEVIKYIKNNLHDVLKEFKEKEFSDSFVNIFMFCCNFKTNEFKTCFDILTPSVYGIIKNKKLIGKYIKKSSKFNIWEYFLNKYKFSNYEVWELKTYFKNQWENVIRTNNIDLNFFKLHIDYVFKSILYYSDSRYYFYEVMKALEEKNFYNSDVLKTKFENFGKTNNLYF